MGAHKEFIVSRDCQAIQIPSGITCILRAGTKGIVTQSRSGWHTVSTDQGLFRIDGKDSEAIGMEAEAAEVFDPSEMLGATDIDALVLKQLRGVYDPEVPVNVVDLGLVYECEVLPIETHRYRVHVKLGLTAPGCGMADVMVNDAKARILAIPLIEEANVELVFDPPWDKSMMTEAAQLELGMY